jgi:arylformamidase
MSSEAPRIFDISPLISERIGVFPGDQKFERKVALDFAHGHHLRLSSILTTLHLGAHADAPSHYSPSGQSIAERSLALYMGSCLVVRAEVARGERVGMRHLSPLWQSYCEKRLKSHSNQSASKISRVLIATSSFMDPDQWNSDFCSLEPELIREFAECGVKLIGIDTPSVDPQDSKELEAHQVVAENDLAVLEGLVLSHVPEGVYTLIALPLKIESADAAPVRAVLVEGANRLD